MHLLDGRSAPAVPGLAACSAPCRASISPKPAALPAAAVIGPAAAREQWSAWSRAPMLRAGPPVAPGRPSPWAANRVPGGPLEAGVLRAQAGTWALSAVPVHPRAAGALAARPRPSAYALHQSRILLRSRFH